MEVRWLDGSMLVDISPPKFLASTKSGNGMNFSALRLRCFQFLASPTSGTFFHSSSVTLIFFLGLRIAG